MLRFRGRVGYVDGTEQEFETGTAALAAYETYALRHGYPIGDQMPPTLGAMVMAHHALGVKEGFDVWRDKVAGVELEADGLPPTSQEPSNGSTSSSPTSSAPPPTRSAVSPTSSSPP